jgi:hypothetical protein
MVCAEDDFSNISIGAILDIKVEPNAQSFIMAPEAVPFHFDGMFFKVPRFV